MVTGAFWEIATTVWVQMLFPEELKTKAISILIVF